MATARRDVDVVVLPDAFVSPADLTTGLNALAGTGADPIVHDHPHGADRAVKDWDSAEDLALFHLDKLRADGPAGPTILIGAGLGGWIALEMALRARELFDRLVLVAPYGVKFGPPTEADFADILLLDTAEVLELGWADPARAFGLRLPGFPADLDDLALEQVFEERTMLARIGWKPFLHSPRLGRWLHTIDLPVLVITGSRDQLVPPANSQALAAALPRAELVEIGAAGHYPYLEQPGAFAEAVGPFIVAHEEAPNP